MEKQNRTLGKVLWTAAIVMTSLTAAMNILGGLGTTCAAFFTKKYPPMWSLLDYQWLYQALVVVTILIGAAGAYTVYRLVRGRNHAFRDALIVLVVGTVVGGIHMAASLILRGQAVPANVKFYLNLGTLLVLLLLRLPSIRERVDFSKPTTRVDRATGSGLAAIVIGILVLSTAGWAAPSHTFQGENWAMLLEQPLLLSGGFFLLVGAAQLLRIGLEIFRQETHSHLFEERLKP